MNYKGFLVFLVVSFSIASVSYSQDLINLEIQIKDSSGIEDLMFKKLHLTNRILIKFGELDSKIDQILMFYENSGFPFVKVNFDSVQPFPKGIVGALCINPGGLVIIDTLMNRTGFRISPSVLNRIINIRPGDKYREMALKEASVRLDLISYMKQIRPLEVGFHNGNASIYVYPEKSSANRFDGWVGLSPDLRSANKLAFSGLLSLDLHNVLSQGENWQFDWRRNQDASQKLSLIAHAPYLAGLPLGLQGKFDLFRQDTSYLNIGWELGVPYHFGPLNSLNVFIRHKESSIIGNTADGISSTWRPFTSMISGVAWEMNNLDNQINPYHGLHIRLEAGTGRKTIPDSASVQQSEFSANIFWFQPLTRNFTCSLGLQSGYRITPETYENEQYRLGGLNLLRGFDEDVFFTSLYAVSSIELRYLLDKSSHLILLSDLGFLRASEKNIPVFKLPVGFGLGGQIRTSGGIFRIIFALGKQGGEVINLKNSKIHLGYVGVF